MKFKCRRTDLLQAISTTDRAVAAKSTMYILEGIYIGAKEDEARFIGNNLELGIDFVIPAEIEEAGEIVVKASLFSDAVKKLPDTEETAIIEVDEKGIINLSCGYAKFDFATFNVEEFPRLPEVDEKMSITLLESEFKKMLRQTAYAIATTDIKPVLTGVYFDISGGIINVVGCDGYRLAIKRCETKIEETIKFIIPGKTTKELLTILDDNSEYEIKFILSSKYIKLQLKNCVFISRLVDGEYMNYEVVLKNTPSLTVISNTKQLLNSIDRAALIINEAMKNYVVLNISDDTINVNCESVIGKVKDRITAETDGEAIEIAFNPRYLMDALKNIEKDKIKIQFSTPSTPVIIEPVDDNSFISIVTPVRMRKW